MKLLITIIIFLLVSITNGATYQTVTSGDWVDNNTWFNNKPDFNKLNQDLIFIGAIDEPHLITLGSEANPVNVGDGNGVEITIRSGSTLIIYGDITVKNNFKIKVDEGGVFILYGNVHLGGGTGTGSEGQLIIDGVATISGDLTGNGSVYGYGELYVGGIVGNGINGSIITGNTDLSLIAPINLRGIAKNDGITITVELFWDFPTEEPNFVGFQVFRDGVIISTIYNSEFIESFPYVDYATVVVSYYVRAIYNINSNVTYSQISNIENFNGSPLPIELLYFNAKVNNNSVILEWKTISEINNDYFVIEKSIDLKNWEVVGYETGNGTTTTPNLYKMVDYYPYDNITYYRLTQTDYDGQFEVFNPLLINFEKTIDFLISRVTKNSIIITLPPLHHNINIMVFNISGNVLYDIDIYKSTTRRCLYITLNHNTIKSNILFIKIDTIILKYHIH
jgi:hypothetical protein